MRTIPFPEGLALVIAESGKKRELASGDYNARRVQTRAAADALHVRALRDVTSSELNNQPILADLLRRRAAHIVGENERVWCAVDLLAAGDGPGFGALMNASHESSRKNFEQHPGSRNNSRGSPARACGGGFGGATITFCEQHAAEAVGKQLVEQYL